MANSFLKNFSYLIAGSVLGRALNMVTNIILARWLEPSGYGEYSLVLTYITLFSAISSLGMQFIINKYVARNQGDSKRYLLICFFWRTIGYVIAGLSLLLYNKVGNINLDVYILYCLLAGIFCDSLWGGLQSVAFGMQRMEWNSIIDVLISLITLISYLCIQYLCPSFITVKIVIAIYIGLYLIKNVIYWGILNKTKIIQGCSNLKSIDKKSLLKIAKEGFPFYVLVLMGLFTNQFPILFLEQHSGLEQVAYFNTANKLLLPVTMLLSTALTALFPNQAQLFFKDRAEFWKKSKSLLIFLMLLGCTFAFCISIFRNEIVYLLYGDKYRNTGTVMAFQCWYIVMFAIFSLNGNILGAADRQKLLSYESIMYAIFTTPIIYIGSFYGADGLSSAYVIASLINIVYLYIILYRVSMGAIPIRELLISILMLLLFSISSFLIPVELSFIIKLFIVFILLSVVLKIFTYVKKGI